MLSQTDLEREQYEARRKFQLDYNTGLKVARMEGKAEGIMEVIRLCQRMLNRPLTPAEELARLTADELAQLSAELQTEALKNK